jgi:putative flavoprotein involved in K+ transport
MKINADAPEAFRPTWPVAINAPTSLNLQAAGIETVIWATGYRRTYPWLLLPVLDHDGEIIHQGGVTPVPGVYVIGMPFQRQRNSSFIDGVGSDARVIAQAIANTSTGMRAA